MDRTDPGASPEAPLFSPPPPVPGSWDRPAKPISGAWSMQAPERPSASVHRQPSLSDSERDMYSEALSPWLHATPEYHGATLPEWHDTSADTVVEEEAADRAAPSPEAVAPSPEPTAEPSDYVPGYRYTSIIDSTIPEESFEASRSQTDMPPPAEATAPPELVGLGMSGTVAGFSARQAYLKELGYAYPTPNAPAPAAPKPSLSYRMPPIEALRICKQDRPTERVPSDSSGDVDPSRTTRAVSGASFVFSPATAMAEQAWQPPPPPPPILRPRIPSVSEQETVVAQAAPELLPVRLPDTHTYSPPLQTIHIVRGSPPPWAMPLPRTALAHGEVEPAAERAPRAAEPAQEAPAMAAESAAQAPVPMDAPSSWPDEAPVVPPPEPGAASPPAPDSSDAYTAWAQDATLIGSSDTKLSSDDAKLKDMSVSSWMAPPSDQETSALGLHIPEPLPTPQERHETPPPVADPAPACEEPQRDQPAPAPPITSVWSLTRSMPAEPAPPPEPSDACLAPCRVSSDARVVDASYVATPRAVSYGTVVLDEAYVSPGDTPGEAQQAPPVGPSRSYPAVPRKAPPVVSSDPPPVTGAAPALSSFTSMPAQGLRAPLDYSVPFPLLFQSRRSSGRTGRRLSSIDVPREAPREAPRDDARGRASLDEQRLPSRIAAGDRPPKPPTVRPTVSKPPTLSPFVASPEVPPTPPPKSWLAPATAPLPRASAAPSYARDYGVLQPALQPLQGAPVASKEGRHVWLDADPDHSHLSMLGAVDDGNDSFNFESYFEHSLQRIRAEIAQIGAEAPPRRSAAKAAAQEAARVAARAGVRHAPATAPMDLTHNAPPVSAENVGSPLMSLDEFTYVMDEDGVALSTPHLGLRSPSEPPASMAPALPPLDTCLPEEHEVMGDHPPVAWVFHDDVRSAFADEPMPTDYRLPLDFVTKPNSVLSRGRPVKKTDQESIFYSSGPDVRRRRVGPPPSVPMWNFEEGDEDELPSPRPAPAPAQAPRPASPPLLHDAAAPPVTEAGRVEDDAQKQRGADPKFASWWRRKMSSVKTPSAPPSDGPRLSEASSEPRTSTSTSTTMKYGRRTAPPGFEPSQPGKYFLAGTVSLPTLNIARTPEQRARHETGLAETEPSLIQSLLAAPSSSTVRARAGIVKALHFDEAHAPPTGQVLVSEERKVLVRPVM
ncbi:hypothetical protein MCAP1_002835 [Malassezia caprae]|uniref:Uncharacterized protein n=1 Tax=Malassezia caprae TaxID=1381934 RepID=A0AAF0IXJ1_9BASI|nr:hypothetical protein MCAP1_002835 [Malassezia caprae]